MPAGDLHRDVERGYDAIAERYGWPVFGRGR